MHICNSYGKVHKSYLQAATPALQLKNFLILVSSCFDSYIITQGCFQTLKRNICSYKNTNLMPKINDLFHWLCNEKKSAYDFF